MLEEDVVAKLKQVYDPEIPINIYELGLIYDVKLDEHNVQITMTLTSPHCPVAESLPCDVKNKVKEIDGVGEVDVKITWEPPWTPEKMSEAAKLELNIG